MSNEKPSFALLGKLNEVMNADGVDAGNDALQRVLNYNFSAPQDFSMHGSDDDGSEAGSSDADGAAPSLTNSGVSMKCPRPQFRVPEVGMEFDYKNTTYEVLSVPEQALNILVPDKIRNNSALDAAGATPDVRTKYFGMALCITGDRIDYVFPFWKPHTKSAMIVVGLDHQRTVFENSWRLEQHSQIAPRIDVEWTKPNIENYAPQLLDANKVPRYPTVLLNSTYRPVVERHLPPVPESQICSAEQKAKIETLLKEFQQSQRVIEETHKQMFAKLTDFVNAAFVEGYNVPDKAAPVPPKTPKTPATPAKKRAAPADGEKNVKKRRTKKAAEVETADRVATPVFEPPETAQVAAVAEDAEDAEDVAADETAETAECAVTPKVPEDEDAPEPKKKRAPAKKQEIPEEEIKIYDAAYELLQTHIDDEDPCVPYTELGLFFKTHKIEGDNWLKLMNSFFRTVPKNEEIKKFKKVLVKGAQKKSMDRYRQIKAFPKIPYHNFVCYLLQKK